MDFVTIIIIGVVTSFAVIIVKPLKPEIAILIGLAGSIMIIIMSIDLVIDIIDNFQSIFTFAGLTSEILSPIFKMVGIGYLCEFSANICADTGNASIADKILLAGKILILYMSLPIINSLVSTIMGLL